VDVSIGTFNLNNLFTRRNLTAAVPPGTELMEVMTLDANAEKRLRTFKGRVVKGNR
jgi:hypothetical protein